MAILDRVNSPDDVRLLPQSAIKSLCQELRDRIITVTRQNGGHLASSLGTVEIMVALLRSYDLSKDRFIFDVGHQTYAWKLMTGRREAFSTIRTEGGLSGFPKRAESPYDHFDTGHSSTALSAALGYATARDLRGEKHQVVALVGDGAMINGQSFEALNHAGALQTRITCILNDNGISISPRIGGMAIHLATLSASSPYLRAKKTIKNLCGPGLEARLERFRNRVKSLVSRPNVFDDMGWTYWGPFDGHDEELLEQVFQLAHYYEKPLMIHVVTCKGKGDIEAECKPVKNHGVGPKPKTDIVASETWSAAVASAVTELAANDSRVVAITPAMGEGAKLGQFAQRFPSRFFDTGIAEEHAVTFAAGLAAGGLLPFVFIYSTFLQRAMDQLVHDVALQNLPVIFAIDRAGLIGEDGETHQGLFDVAWCSVIPGLEFWAPADRRGLKLLFEHGLTQRKAPLAFRFPRGAIEENLLLSFRERDSGFTVLTEESEWGILALGSDVSLALKAREEARRQKVDIPDVACLERISPWPEKELLKFCRNHRRVVTLEAGYIKGGIGERLKSTVHDHQLKTEIVSLGVPSIYVPHMPAERQRELMGLSVGRILKSRG